MCVNLPSFKRLICTKSLLGNGAGLHSEQKALVDLLVLAQAHKYVGSLRSSYSCFARDIRTLRHKERDSTVIIRVGDFPASVLPFQELAVA